MKFFFMYELMYKTVSLVAITLVEGMQETINIKFNFEYLQRTSWIYTCILLTQQSVFVFENLLAVTQFLSCLLLLSVSFHHILRIHHTY